MMKAFGPVLWMLVPPLLLDEDEDEDELDDAPPEPIEDEPPFRSNVVNLHKPVVDLTLNGPSLMTLFSVLLMVSRLDRSSGVSRPSRLTINWPSRVAMVTSSAFTERLRQFEGNPL